MREDGYLGASDASPPVRAGGAAAASCFARPPRGYAPTAGTEKKFGENGWLYREALFPSVFAFFPPATGKSCMSCVRSAVWRRKEADKKFEDM